VTRLLPFAVAAIGLVGCPSDLPPAADDDDAATPFEVIEWTAGPPPMSATATPGHQALRVIAHLHSHWSHDACDGVPQPGGVPDEACYQDLRQGLCTTRIDVAFLSDHPGHATETDYATLLLRRDGDGEIVDDAGAVVGTVITCPDGHEVRLFPGVESGDMMPLALDAHVDGGYGGSTAADQERVSDAGGIRWIAHTETRDLETLRAMQLEGIELYQLHANLAPDLREDYLGLDPFGYLGEVGPFFFPETNGVLDPPHPDLAPLGFLALNEPSIVALETLGQDQVLAVTGGTDAHQNVFPAEASDFERIDSYRRMMRWFNNWLLLPENEEVSPATLEAAMRGGKGFIVFEVFGTPEGFAVDVRPTGVETPVAFLGDEIALGDGLEVVVQPPNLDLRSPRDEALPLVTTRVYLADAEGRTLLAEQDGSEPIRASVSAPGVLRVEVWITPRHLRPYLGEVADDYVDTPIPWVQTGGIFVR